MLLAAFGARRATRDVDLQGRHLANNVDAVLSLVREIASITLDDGLRFRADQATAQTIREDDNYHGVRVSLATDLATAQISFHIDVNVGDPIWPAPRPLTLPGLLGRDIELLGYPLSMVHAEKIVTAVDRGVTNTRWRDFADIYTLSGKHPSDGAELRGSIVQVATYRNVALAPLARILQGFADTAQRTWAIWLRKQPLLNTVPNQLDETVAAVSTFADPILTGEVTVGVWNPVDRAWYPR